MNPTSIIVSGGASEVQGRYNWTEDADGNSTPGWKQVSGSNYIVPDPEAPPGPPQFWGIFPYTYGGAYYREAYMEAAVTEPVWFWLMFQAEVIDTCVATALGVDLPVIETQPVPVSVAAGGEAVFSVVASGIGPLSYQWMKGGVRNCGGDGQDADAHECFGSGCG